ncbi:hypothetical protein [Streptococcus suis]|uniref:Uncharacterized protein n=2 Tax=Streptococcus suis TaxID=1307 RepID=A0A2I5KLR8_STRSU|nr:hypothetical protein [Streptococcus suis]BCP58421.1 hypothetical protein SUT007_18790 [Streptococcus parasuis]AUA18294.1 hypothetical protein CWI26_01600 [Streptococcus suis]MDW8597594.1 sigma-70 family RNA polymerase sigma factor [Streptococcus suis]MDW8607824.1 sigma-70 family RNA polymerase sigma factor [Streptococcus suis]MDW8617535.1 sigma-70 family RNA polymerase sigma factor [Streptococcus suis]
MTNKVENKRELKIAKAVKKNDWQTVDRLLDQPINNLERKERYHQVTNLNNILYNEDRVMELMDFYSDNSYNPVEFLLIKERNEYLYNVLSGLPKDDLHILLETILHGTSALQLTKETSFKSHKTVQKHFEDTLDFLRNELKDYF